MELRKHLPLDVVGNLLKKKGNERKEHDVKKKHERLPNNLQPSAKEAVSRRGKNCSRHKASGVISMFHRGIYLSVARSQIDRGDGRRRRLKCKNNFICLQGREGASLSCATEAG